MLKIDDLLAPVHTGVPVIDDMWKALQACARASFLDMSTAGPICAPRLNGVRVVHETRRDAVRRLDAGLAPYGYEVDACALRGGRWTATAHPVHVRTCRGRRR
jgi:hypothetical protein